MDWRCDQIVDVRWDEVAVVGRRERAVNEDDPLVRAKIPDLVGLGVNAIEFLPWTAWADDNYGWGHTPGSSCS